MESQDNARAVKGYSPWSARHANPRRRPQRGLIALGLVVVLVIVGTGIFALRDHIWGVRADARAAVQALKSGELGALEEQLGAYRGRQDFAYYFTSEVTSRDLGDSLASVAGAGRGTPLKAGVNPPDYELMLTDLAGTVALASHGTKGRALPSSWTEDFIAATTNPATLYAADYESVGEHSTRRAAQDNANRVNLLLLLSRGHWSPEFLNAVTTQYVEHDRREGDGAWPSAKPDKNSRYAPAPNGVYLTDGILALSAALTASPVASEWAFTEFQPGSVQVEGTDYKIGKFTHFLLFEHHFSDVDAESVGITATLTALSSAIDAGSDSIMSQAHTQVAATAAEVGPAHDAAVLQALAQTLTESGECSWNPTTWEYCVVAVAKAVWRWVQRWGHVALEVLALGASFTPSPFVFIGIGAAVSNAAWYAIEGDYGSAGLSLATAIPGLAFLKLAKSVKAGAAAQRAAAKSDDVAKVSREFRAAAPFIGERARPSVSTQAEVRATASKNADGDYIDPNTGAVIPHDGPYDFGHKPGHEWRCIAAMARKSGWSNRQVQEFANQPWLYQIEDPSSNRSGKYESKTCAI